MKRRLSNSQRQAIQKALYLILSATIFLSVMASIPYLASLVPKFSASATQNMLAGSSLVPETTPAFALGSGVEYEKPKLELLDKPVNPPQNNPEAPNEPSEPEPPSEPIPQPQEGDLPVFSDNLCWYEKDEAPTLDLINRTNYDISLDDYISRAFPISAQITDKPLVLIVHTHGSEAYLPNKQGFYSPEEDFRSEKEDETVVGIGDILCQRLNRLGIPAIQDKTMHDIPDYNSSYVNSSKAIEKILAENPSIRFVIDLHRDSVFDSDGNNVKPLTVVDGKECAQLMLVVGTDQMGIPHPNWRQNLTFATYLQQQINSDYPTLARPVNVRVQEFNQSYTKGSIILEVGSCGNTVEEAENAINLFAESYARLLMSKLSN